MKMSHLHVSPEKCRRKALILMEMVGGDRLELPTLSV